MGVRSVFLLFLFEFAVRGEEDIPFDAILAAIGQINDGITPPPESRYYPGSHYQHDPNPKYNNPYEIQDQLRAAEYRPNVGDLWADKFKQPWTPSQMDYCDPYHCNDFHRLVCGIHRNPPQRFKLFHSGCHLALHNLCAKFRGGYQYKGIAVVHCNRFTVHRPYSRSSCPASCGQELSPVCGISSRDSHVVLFRNECAFDAANCRNETLNEYERSKIEICNVAANKTAVLPMRIATDNTNSIVYKTFKDSKRQLTDKEALAEALESILP